MAQVKKTLKNKHKLKSKCKPIHVNQQGPFQLCVLVTAHNCKEQF